jgi:hypothetical protein
MLFSTPALSVALLATLSAAAPAALEVRQGGYYVAVGVKYSGPGCNPASTPIGDPIFGYGNVCQPLDRFGDGAPIVSYQTSSVTTGCSGKCLLELRDLGYSSVGYHEIMADTCGSDIVYRRGLYGYCVLSSSGRLCDG